MYLIETSSQSILTSIPQIKSEKNLWGYILFHTSPRKLQPKTARRWEAWRPVRNKFTLEEAVTFAAKISLDQSVLGECGRWEASRFVDHLDSVSNPGMFGVGPCQSSVLVSSPLKCSVLEVSTRWVPTMCYIIRSFVELQRIQGEWNAWYERRRYFPYWMLFFYHHLLYHIHHNLYLRTRDPLSSFIRSCRDRCHQHPPCQWENAEPQRRSAWETLVRLPTIRAPLGRSPGHRISGRI